MKKYDLNLFLFYVGRQKQIYVLVKNIYKEKWGRMSDAKRNQQIEEIRCKARNLCIVSVD
jgi:hypothetical protein